jgi:hypothetical protein
MIHRHARGATGGTQPMGIPAVAVNRGEGKVGGLVELGSADAIDSDGIVGRIG